jgi:hypothetical protein
MTARCIRGQLFFLVLAAAPLFYSCASYSYDKIDREVRGGGYPAALETIEKDKKAMYGKDAVRYYLDKGMVTHYAGRYGESTGLLEKGDRAIEDAFTKSVTRNAASFIANDNTKEYAGEDYENIYLNVFNALNYYHLKNIEDAMVEIRRMQEKLRGLAVRYNLVDQELAKENKDAAKSAKVEVNFTDSALARYLGMLFYRATGRYDDARIDRDWLKRVFSAKKTVYNYPIPTTIDGELEIPAGMARLNLLCFAGLAPLKKEETTRIPFLLTGGWIKIALPKMVKRESDIGAIEVVFSDGKRTRLELLEDIQNVAIETFKKHQGVIEAKSIIRASVKSGAAAGFSIAGEYKDSAALSIIGLALQIFAETSEAADVRITRYFPARAYTAGVTLAPGTYSFTVNYYGLSGHVIAAYSFPQYQVKAGALNLVETCFLK